MTPADLRATVRAHVARGRVARRAGREEACSAVAALLEARGDAGEVVDLLRSAGGAISQRAALAAAGRWADALARRGVVPPAGLALLTATEAAAWLGVGVRTVERWRAARVISPAPGPGVLRYRREDVAWLIETRRNRGANGA